MHVGGSHTADGARVVVVDASSGRILQQVTDQPGDFRVPVWSPHDNLLTYIEHDDAGDDVPSCTMLIPVRKVRSPQSGVVRSLCGMLTDLPLPSVRLRDPGHRRFPG